MKKILLSAVAGAALTGAAATTTTFASGIEIVPEYEPQTELGRSITAEEFREEFSLDILTTDPRGLDGEALRRLARELDLTTALGRPIVDLFAMPETGELIGVGEGSVTLVDILPDGAPVILTQDEGGAYVPAEPDSLGWFGPGGERRCFELVPVSQSRAPMHFTLMLDRSGSMRGEMEEVLAVTAEFLEALPENAQCTVVSFNDGVSVHTAGTSQACGAAAAPARLNAGGATDIYGPLAAAFERYGGLPYAIGQRAVIIVTDGADTASGNDAEEIRAELLAAKGDTRVIVAWLGSHTDAYLADLADYSLAREVGEDDGEEVADFLSGIYGVLEEAYGTQTVLRPMACPAEHAGP